MIFGTGIAILTTVYPPSRRGHALGIIAIRHIHRSFFRPGIGGFMAFHLSWRSIFYLTALIVGFIRPALRCGASKKANGRRHRRPTLAAA